MQDKKWDSPYKDRFLEDRPYTAHFNAGCGRTTDLITERIATLQRILLEKGAMTMKKILFICHGNICRSPMAEFVLKQMAAEHGLDWEIASAATSREEIGNDIHYGTRTKLRQMNISFTRRQARQITEQDYESYDLLIGMDKHNLINMKRFYGSDPQNKLCLLLDFTEHPRDIADPWYSGDFDATYSDIKEGCEGLIKKIADA